MFQVSKKPDANLFFLFFCFVALWALKFCGNNQVLLHINNVDSFCTFDRDSRFKKPFFRRNLRTKSRKAGKSAIKLHAIINFYRFDLVDNVESKYLRQHVNFVRVSQMLLVFFVKTSSVMPQIRSGMKGEKQGKTHIKRALGLRLWLPRIMIRRRFLRDLIIYFVRLFSVDVLIMKNMYKHKNKNRKITICIFTSMVSFTGCTRLDSRLDSRVRRLLLTKNLVTIWKKEKKEAISLYNILVLCWVTFKVAIKKSLRHSWAREAKSENLQCWTLLNWL